MKSVRFCSQNTAPNSPQIRVKFIDKKQQLHQSTRKILSNSKLNLDNNIIIPSKKNIALKSLRMLELQEKHNQLIQLRQILMKQYKSLQLFYQTNQDKLKKIIQNQLSLNRIYLYSKQIMNFIIKPQLDQLKDLNYQVFKNDLIKITHFMTNFNAKKRIKQVEIMKESMLSREKMIRQSSANQEYEEIYKKMKPPLKSSGYTIYDQYKSIRNNINLPFNPIKIHQQLYNKIGDTEQCINQVMKKQSKLKKLQRLSLLGLQSCYEEQLD